MSILLGMGIAATVTAFIVFYLGKKSWRALHKAVGITPGVLTYQHPNTVLSTHNVTWQNLVLRMEHFNALPDNQRHQLQRIDKKVATYHSYQQNLQAQSRTLVVSEQDVVLHKLLDMRLPENLASYYYLMSMSTNSSFNATNNTKRIEASRLLQEMLDNIEYRLDTLLETFETQSLQELRAMKRYIDSLDIP